MAAITVRNSAISFSEPLMLVVPRAALAFIVVAYVCFAVTWAIRTPIFAPPDEMAHADYMYAFFDSGGFYRTTAVPSDNDVLAETKYLDQMSGYRRIHYNKFGRVPATYGSSGYFQRLVANAPIASGTMRPPGSTMPYVMSTYPATYYIIVADLARLIALGDRRATVQAFFVARGFSVLLGVGTILLAYATFLNCRFGIATSLLSAAGIAMLPLFSWVSAYIQPDNLVIFLVTLAVWSAQRKRPSYWWLTLAISCLCLVKVHYGVALWLPALVYTVGRARLVKSSAAPILLVVVLPLVCTIASFHLTPVSEGLSNVTNTVRSSDPRTLGFAYVTQLLENVLGSVYFGGSVFTNYWLGYGTHGFYFTKPQSVFVASLLSAVTVPILFACVLLYCARAFRIVRVGLRRGVPSALRLFFAGFAVNVYLSYTALLLCAATLTKEPLSLEARYWLPLLVPTTIIVVGDLSQALPRRIRVKAAMAVSCATLALVVPIDAITPWVIQRDYYTPTKDIPPYNFGGLVVNSSGDAESFHSRETHVNSRQLVTLRGFALDIVSGLPADRVEILSDGHIVAFARRIRWDVEPAAEWHDDVLESAGFEARFPAKAFGVGRHDLSVVARRRGEPARPLEHHVELFVSS